MPTCRFCKHRRPRSLMFHWFDDIWECLDLKFCEASERLRGVP